MSITVFKPNGEAFDYRKVSERLPEFLSTFPLTEGYRVVRTHRFMIEHCPGLIRLYEAAINQGKSIYDMGLPEITTSVIFEASLYRNEDLIANASASKVVVSYKDWECGETAAFQRLMAACGFGGEMLDLDSDADFAAQSLRVEVSEPDNEKRAKKTKSTKKAQRAEGVEEEPGATNPVSEVEEEPVSAPTQETPPAETPEPEDNPEERRHVVTEPIQPQLMSVLRQLAISKGVEMPKVQTNAEAREVIRDLKRAS